MSETRTVNALVEALRDPVEPTQSPQTAGSLLRACRQCKHWDRGCTLQDSRSWVSQLITPGRVCPF